MKTIKFKTGDYLVIQFTEDSRLPLQNKKQAKEALSTAFPEAQGRIIVLGADENLTVVSTE